MDKLKQLAKRVVPKSVYRPLGSRLRRWPPVRWGNLRRVNPFSEQMGLDRGAGIDRYYIESFLDANRDAIKGRVLEVADNHYTLRFGGAQVTKSEVLHAVAGNPEATIVGNLETGKDIPSESFDCIICTQTLPFLYDFHGAIKTIHQALKVNGVVLATFAGITQISRYDMERWGDFWRFTSLSAERMFADIFGKENVKVKAHGNSLTAIASIMGLSVEELKKSELDYFHKDYEQLITVRAVKGAL